MPQSTADYAFRKRNDELDRYINLKLVALGQPPNRNTAGSDLVEIAGPLLRNYYQKDQLLAGRLCPADSRIQTFLDGHLGDVCPSEVARFPANTFVLDREGMARVLSLPVTTSLFAPYAAATISRSSCFLPSGVSLNLRPRASMASIARSNVGRRPVFGSFTVAAE